jgi:oligopeptidase B
MSALLLSVVALATAQLDMPKPPVAKKVPHVVELHGEKLVDNYFWMREKGTKDVLDYLNAENSYCDAVMKPTETLQEELYKEMLSRIKQTDLSVPRPEGGYLYYTRTEEGKQYPIHCRKKGESGAEEILLDVNKLAEGEKFMSVSALSVSDDGNLLAYSTDNTGFRQYKLHIKDLRTGVTTANVAERVRGIVWAADNKTIFYGTEDPTTKRSDRIFRMALGGKPEQIFEEKDALYGCGVDKSLDKKYIFIQSSCSENDEVWYLDAKKPRDKFKLIEKRQGELEYSVEHRDGEFIIRTNRDNRDFEIMATPVSRVGKKNWSKLIPAQAGETITGFQVFKNHLVYSKRSDGLPSLTVYDFATRNPRKVPTAELLCTIGLSANSEFDTTKVRYSYSSPITSASVFELDLKTMASKLLKQTEVPGGYDPKLYGVDRIYANAPDGKRVPIGIVYRKDKKGPGTNPCLLGGYGSYGSSASFGFNSNVFSLLDRGFVMATAQIRGGSDMGIAWHDDGKMLKKRNTFTDFIAAADELVYSGWTTREKLAISGGSAGGLLIGATINMRPDLCKAAVLYVPFVDVINTMYDETLPLTVGEFLEWGNPKKEDEFRYMLSYSPYENIRPTNYPDLLVKTSYNDSQVMYWEPAKYVARMREFGKPASLIFKTNMAGGHGGSSGRFDALRERALDYAWLIQKLAN